MNKTLKASRIATLIIFLALIRCICEPFRLERFSSVPIGFNEARPFLIGALVSGVGLFIMTILSYWHQYRMMILVGVATFIGLLLSKWVYL